MVHRTKDIENLVKQGFDQLAAANALELTGNDFVHTAHKLLGQVIILTFA